MKKLYEWILKQKTWVLAIVCIVVFIVPLVVVHILYKWYLGIPWLIPEWEPGDVLAYVAGFEALVGTVMLGSFSLWQNERFKEENDKSQERLEKISEEQAKALEHILLIDKSSNIPLADLRESTKNDGFMGIDLFFEEDSTAAFIRVSLTNITQYPMKDFHVQNIELFTYDFKYIIDENKIKYNPHKGLPGHYNTHAAFYLLPISCKEKNGHFKDACPLSSDQKLLEGWAYNKQFILKITFEIQNIYGKMIQETAIYEFRRGSSDTKSLCKLWNQELTFEIVEESDNA